MRRALLALLALALASSVHCASIDLDKLRAGDEAHGFRVSTVYVDGADRPRGARFMHRATGFTLDLLRIESVPQAFTWVNTFATSDQGEPHTQEHLLLLRGVRGRTLQTRMGMSLAVSSAFTQTWRTSYFFHTTAGVDTFFDIFAEQQRAMLHPDYSDAEIRLEVRNFGVTRGRDGMLRLEEKGTVYNEMVSSMANAGWKAWRAASHAVYGEKHPLGYNQGGEPAGIRTMTPRDIRDFHRASHHLANMGTIAAFPRSVALDGVLARFDRMLSRDAPQGAPRRADSLASLPPPKGDPEGAIRIYEYPHANDQQPSPLSIVWPATRDLDADELLLAELFFANLAGDATTNLYRIFIDSRTRRLDIGARSVSASVQQWGGNPIQVSFTDVLPARMGDEGVRAIRQAVMDEIGRVAGFADGSAELKEFNDRIASRVVARERAIAKFVGTPPRFGFRSGGSDWMDHLLVLEKAQGTRKSLALKPQFEHVRGLLATNANFWRDRLARWKVTGVTPYVAGARPSPALIASEAAERDERLKTETERIKSRYGLEDTQEALRRHAADSDAEFAKIEAATRVPPTPFVGAPPLTLDDQMRFEHVKLANGVPLVAARFDDMTGAHAGIALRLDGVPREELRYVSLLPALLTTVGVIEAGRPVAYETMRERLRREVLTFEAAFSTNPRTGRVELVVRGAGIGEAESRRALEWMALALHAPDWRPENLPRIRDVVDQALSALRNTTQRPEERWVNDPPTAYRMQRHGAHLAADSFLTRGHNALRLRWLLKDPPAGDAEAVGALLARVAEGARGLPRAELKALLTPAKAPGMDSLTSAQQALAGEALRDLDLTLAEIPDESLAADFAYLVGALRSDLLTPPAQALAGLDSLRKRLLVAGGARMFLASPAKLRTALEPAIADFAARLANSPFERAWPGTEAIVDARLRLRDPKAAPVHLGLYAPNKQGGVIVTSVPSAHFSDHGDKEKQLDYLASRLHSGYGSHGVFSKTVGAGLAYSNGLRGSVSSGRLGYYAERTPELPQTVRFVVDILKTARVDAALGDYVLAQAFGESRAADTYEARAEGIAADLADGQPPEQVRRFRQSLLELRKDPRLAEKLFERKDRVYARQIPGYDGKPAKAGEGVFFVIGPERQLEAWERYLKATEGEATRLHRLYGRDFWMP